MITNGKVFCDECSLDIKRNDRHVRLPWPQTARQLQPYAHFHNREGHFNDCWKKVKDRAEARAKAKPPSTADMNAYEKFLANREAKTRTIQ